MFRSLSGCTERYLCVASEIKHLVAGSSVALVLDTSCCTGTFVYCTWGSL